MMGPTHALFGAATWVALTGGAATTLPVAANVIPGVDGPLAVLGGAIICAGAGLLPDLDHPGATVARSLPPVSTVASIGVAAASGGHRKYTHTVWAALGLWAVFYFLRLGELGGHLSRFEVGWGVGLTTLLLAGFAFSAWKLSFGALGAWPLAVIAAVVSAFVFSSGVSWLPWVVLVGFVSHLVGDSMTDQGLLPFRPLKLRVRVPILGEAGSGMETVFGIVFAAYIFAVFAAIVFSQVGIVP